MCTHFQAVYQSIEIQPDWGVDSTLVLYLYESWAGITPNHHPTQSGSSSLHYQWTTHQINNRYIYQSHLYKKKNTLIISYPLINIVATCIEFMSWSIDGDSRSNVSIMQIAGLDFLVCVIYILPILDLHGCFKNTLRNARGSSI